MGSDNLGQERLIIRAKRQFPLKDAPLAARASLFVGRVQGLCFHPSSRYNVMKICLWEEGGSG